MKIKVTYKNGAELNLEAKDFKIISGWIVYNEGEKQESLFNYEKIEVGEE